METTPDPSSPPATNPVSRRRFLRYALAAATVPVLGGVYTWQVEPFWVDYHEVSVPVAGLPTAFEGFRIVHLTDLHASANVPMSYLNSVARRVEQARPDLVCVTGDLVTHDFTFVRPVAEMLGSIQARVAVSLGNHDYDAEVDRAIGTMRLATAITEAVSAQPNCIVLRNAATAIDRGDDRMWVVGLEDLWSGAFAPEVAFNGVGRVATTSSSAPAGRDEPVICLSHNPDSARKLDDWAPQLVLSGHTHGGQVRLPLWGALLLPTVDRQFDQGLFRLPNSHLYVSRGVGSLPIFPRVGLRMYCRPEVPTLVLRRA